MEILVALKQELQWNQSLNSFAEEQSLAEPVSVSVKWKTRFFHKMATSLSAIDGLISKIETNTMAEEKKADDKECPYVVDIVKLFGYPGTDDNLAYFIIDTKSQEGVVVDPAVCEPPIMKRYNELKQTYNKLKLVGVLTTHKHHDHTTNRLTVLLASTALCETVLMVWL